MTQILNQLVDHQHGVPIHSATAKSPNELPSWGSPRVTHTNPTLPSSIVSLSLLGNHEEDSRTGLSGRGAAVGIGNVFSSLIHSVARNPSLAKQSFGYAILGFALTEAIASFAPMMAFLISSVFRSKVEVQFHKASLVSLSRAEAFTRRIKKTSVNPWRGWTNSIVVRRKGEALVNQWQ